ncbi:hypothetical protein C8J57DRAFT_1540384 [Mycena rebaudengoi]|nr:hypothetical protein C8J57DRAFT_1540384 [Mycena rebaudengoi]
MSSTNRSRKRTVAADPASRKRRQGDDGNVVNSDLEPGSGLDALYSDELTELEEDTASLTGTSPTAAQPHEALLPKPLVEVSSTSRGVFPWVDSLEQASATAGGPPPVATQSEPALNIMAHVALPSSVEPSARPPPSVPALRSPFLARPTPSISPSGVTEPVAPAEYRSDAVVAVRLPAVDAVGSGSFIQRPPDDGIERVGVFHRIRGTYRVDSDRIDQCSTALLSRIERLLAFRDDVRHVYVANRLPQECAWGTQTAFADKSKLLCKVGGNVPVTVWFVAQMASSWMYDRSGAAADRAMVNFVPLSSEHTVHCANQLSQLSRPQDLTCCSSWGPGQVRAYRWMNVGPRVAGAPQVPSTFVDYFDATTCLQDKSRMQRLPVQDLNEHDLVLVEAHIARYAVRDAAAGQQQGRTLPRRVPMDRWVAFYQLQAIHLLEAAPVSTATDVAGYAGLQI